MSTDFVKIGNKKRRTLGVILLTEYHASSIRLWRVILLRSDIRLRRVLFATRVNRRIEYHCKTEPCNITSRKENITLCVSKGYHLQKTEKRELYGILLPHYSLFCFYCQFHFCNTNTVGLCPYPYFISPIRTTPIRCSPLKLYISVFFCVLTSKTDWKAREWQAQPTALPPAIEILLPFG